MTIVLTDDPILVLSDAMAALADEDADRLTLLINSASDRFKRYTNRLRITAPGEDLIEETSGLGGQDLYLHASPIVSVTMVEILSEGEIEETLYEGDFTIHASEGMLYRNGSVWPFADVERNIRVSYQGGWTNVPGDLVMGAVLLMRMERQRYQGEVGVTNLSRGGQSVSFETTNLPKAVEDAWAAYRILI